jgi:formate-dependent nitrite reductase cytochrome c552 subunit
MPKEYFAKKGNKRSGGGPFLQKDAGYGQGKSPIEMNSPLKHPHRTWKEAHSHDKDFDHSKVTQQTKNGETKTKTKTEEEQVIEGSESSKKIESKKIVDEQKESKSKQRKSWRLWGSD